MNNLTNSRNYLYNVDLFGEIKDNIINELRTAMQKNGKAVVSFSPIEVMTRIGKVSIEKCDGYGKGAVYFYDGSGIIELTKYDMSCEELNELVYKIRVSMGE